MKKTISAILVGLSIVILIFATANHFRVREEINRLKVMEAELDQKKMELSEKLSSLNYDLENSNSYEFIEKAARRQGMIKPREIIVYDLDKDKK